MTAALVRNGIVENIIIAGEGYSPPEGCSVVSIEDAAGLPRLTVDPPAETRESTYQATMGAGHCVTAGYCLGMSVEDRANWSQMLTLFREAEALGAMTGASEVQFWDKDGTARTATLTEFRMMILGLGQAVITAEAARRAIM